MTTEEKHMKMTIFDETISPNFIRGSMVIVSPRNVQL